MFSFTIIPELISRVEAQLNKTQKRVVQNAEKLFIEVSLYGPIVLHSVNYGILIIEYIVLKEDRKLKKLFLYFFTNTLLIFWSR